MNTHFRMLVDSEKVKQIYRVSQRFVITKFKKLKADTKNFGKTFRSLFSPEENFRKTLNTNMHKMRLRTSFRRTQKRERRKLKKLIKIANTLGKFEQISTIETFSLLFPELAEVWGLEARLKDPPDQEKERKKGYSSPLDALPPSKRSFAFGQRTQATALACVAKRVCARIHSVPSNGLARSDWSQVTR